MALPDYQIKTHGVKQGSICVLNNTVFMGLGCVV